MAVNMTFSAYCDPFNGPIQRKLHVESNLPNYEYLFPKDLRVALMESFFQHCFATEPSSLPFLYGLFSLSNRIFFKFYRGKALLRKGSKMPRTKQIGGFLDSFTIAFENDHSVIIQ
jgi:hypothetical protein